MQEYYMYKLICCVKTKAAYDMRISDWSSDVCSSDLIGRRIFALIDAEVVNAGGVIGKCGTMRFDRPASRRGTRQCQRQTRETRTQTQRDLEQMRAQAGEIGRASCRERVCPYV